MKLRGQYLVAPSTNTIYNPTEQHKWSTCTGHGSLNHSFFTWIWKTTMLNWGALSFGIFKLKRVKGCLPLSLPASGKLHCHTLCMMTRWRRTFSKHFEFPIISNSKPFPQSFTIAYFRWLLLFRTIFRFPWEIEIAGFQCILFHGAPQLLPLLTAPPPPSTLPNMFLGRWKMKKAEKTAWKKAKRFLGWTLLPQLRGQNNLSKFYGILIIYYLFARSHKGQSAGFDSVTNIMIMVY